MLKLVAISCMVYLHFAVTITQCTSILDFSRGKNDTDASEYSWNSMKQCPNESFVSGLSLKFKDNVELELVTAVRFHCSKQHSLGKSGHGQIEVELLKDATGSWTKELHCSQGVVVGVQIKFVEPDQSLVTAADGFARNIRARCSNGEILQYSKKSDDYWDDGLGKCENRQSICGLQTPLLTGNETAPKRIQIGCCDVPDRSLTCTPKKTWHMLSYCENPIAKTPKTCTYSKKIGLSYNGKGDEGSIHEDVGYQLASVGANLQSKMSQVSLDHLNNTGEEYKLNWVAEGKEEYDEFTAEPGFNSSIYQMIGHCGFYKIRMNSFKEEAVAIVENSDQPEHKLTEKQYLEFEAFQKWQKKHKHEIEDDGEKMQGDDDDNDFDGWSDEENAISAKNAKDEENKAAPKPEEQKEQVKPPEKSSLEHDHFDSVDTKSSEADKKKSEVKVNDMPLETTIDLSSSGDKKESVQQEVHHLKEHPSKAENSWESEEEDNNTNEFSDDKNQNQHHHKVESQPEPVNIISPRDSDVDVDHIDTEPVSADVSKTSDGRMAQLKVKAAPVEDHPAQNDGEDDGWSDDEFADNSWGFDSKTKPEEPTNDQKNPVDEHAEHQHHDGAPKMAQRVLPTLDSIGNTVTSAFQNVTKALDPEKLQESANNLYNEGQKVITELKEIPIVKDAQDRLEKAASDMVHKNHAHDDEDEHPMQDASVKSEADPAMIEDSSAPPPHSEPKVNNALLGYIVGGMVVAVCIIVIIIFVLEKRKDRPRPRPASTDSGNSGNLKKNEYRAQSEPPLLGKSGDKRITIEQEKESA